ncbi:MAG: anhydro-N-acetylmuramic acid kinase [Burkholderiales bacterium]
MAGDTFVGLMSGTSLDGVDAVLADFSGVGPRVLARTHLPFDDSLRAELSALMISGPDEIARAANAANTLARIYAAAVTATIERAGVTATSVTAVGCHGQTIRHCPELGFTVQIGNAALLAERCGITVVSDFRSRDVAAGGQGAPLAPGFHAAMFSSSTESRAVLNLGGIANITALPVGGVPTGFDCGPANRLLDAWASRHLGERFDDGGRWAGRGREDPVLLDRLLAEPYFSAAPPKSTGRELFNEGWLMRHLAGTEPPADVQATLVALSARTIREALERWCPGTQRLLVCGGGTRNAVLMARIAAELPSVVVEPTGQYGVEPEDVEALAFSWLAREALAGRAGNLPSVTGARGPRVIGAIYPA